MGWKRQRFSALLNCFLKACLSLPRRKQTQRQASSVWLPSLKAAREKQKDKVKRKDGVGDGQGPLAAGRSWERQRWEGLCEDQRRRDGKAANGEREEMAGEVTIRPFQTRIKGHRGLGRASNLLPVNGVFRK